MFLVVRTNSDPAAMTSSIRSEIRNIDPNQPVFNVRTMDDVVEASIAQPRFQPCCCPFSLLWTLIGRRRIVRRHGVFR